MLFYWNCNRSITFLSLRVYPYSLLFHQALADIELHIKIGVTLPHHLIFITIASFYFIPLKLISCVWGLSEARCLCNRACSWLLVWGYWSSHLMASNCCWVKRVVLLGRLRDLLLSQGKLIVIFYLWPLYVDILVFLIYESLHLMAWIEFVILFIL